jgi:ribonuclease D
VTETPTPLTAPVGGVPPLIDTPEALATAARALAEGSGPVAVDSERASGFTYTSRAQLVQLFRRGAGVHLIDAAALVDLSSVNQALDGAECVFHAASQDLPCLREVGLEPQAVFDTELASRLLGEQHVGLAAVVARTLSLGLAKEHSAQNWSVRPLPDAWLTYAALDVAVLLDVRDVLERELAEAGKTEIARQEAAWVLAAPPPAPKPDPWRRTAGAHTLKSPRQLAVLRAMWGARDALGRRRDVFPGRVLPDAALVAAAQAMPSSREDLAAIHPFNGRRLSKLLPYWWDAYSRGASLGPADWPPAKGPRLTTTPPVRHWRRRHPAAADRMGQVKDALAALSLSERIPVENLTQPELVRQVVFTAPADVRRAMAAGGARPWQIDAVAPLIEAAMAAHPDGSD